MITLSDDYIDYFIRCLISIGVGIILYLTYTSISTIYNKINEWWKNKKSKNDNIITIIHKKKDTGSFLKFSSTEYIDLDTQTKFIEDYDDINKEKDINIIIHTTGGLLSSAESICNCILNHNGKGKIIAYIPQYCYSGGFMIALHCNKIVMQKNAVVGPCDAQHGDIMGSHSYSSILKTVDYKKTKNEKINEEWLAKGFDAELTKKRQQECLTKLIKCGRYNNELADKIFDEFFSGKHNHDKNFSAEELKEIGFNIEIVDKMPKFIEDRFKENK